MDMILRRLTVLEADNAELQKRAAAVEESHKELQERYAKLRESHDRLEATLHTTMEAVIGVTHSIISHRLAISFMGRLGS